MNTSLVKFLLSVILAVLAAGSSAGQASSLKISTEAEIKPDIALAPCNDKDRLAAVKSLFERMGAPEDSIRIEKLGKVENLVVTKEGQNGRDGRRRSALR